MIPITLQKFSRLTAVILIVMGTPTATARLGQAQITPPSQIVGTWTRKKTSPLPGGSLTLVETVKFLSNGQFQHSLSTTSPFLGNCTLTTSDSVKGSVVAKTSSTITITTTPGTLTFKNSCGTTTTNTIPALKGTLSWKRQDDNKGQKLCLNGRLSATSGNNSNGIGFNSCYYRQ